MWISPQERANRRIAKLKREWKRESFWHRSRGIRTGYFKGFKSYVRSRSGKIMASDRFSLMSPAKQYWFRNL